MPGDNCHNHLDARPFHRRQRLPGWHRRPQLASKPQGNGQAFPLPCFSLCPYAMFNAELRLFQEKNQRVSSVNLSLATFKLTLAKLCHKCDLKLFLSGAQSLPCHVQFNAVLGCFVIMVMIKMKARKTIFSSDFIWLLQCWKHVGNQTTTYFINMQEVCLI